MNKKNISINIIASICSYSVSILISFILTPYIINSLGKELYSYFSIANNFVSYMSIISIALNSMVSRFIMVEEAKGNHNEANHYFSSMFWGNILLIAFLSIICFLLIFKLEWILNISKKNIKTVKLLFGLVFTTMFVKLISSVFSVCTFIKDKLFFNSIENVISTFIRAISLLFLYTLYQPSILYLGIVNLGLSIIALCYFIFINKKIYPESSIKIYDANISYIKILIGSGVWRAIDSLGGLLLFNTDLIIANIFVGESAGGTLSIVHTFPTMLQGILSAITSVFLPQQTWSYGKNDVDGLLKKIKMSQKVCGAIVSIPLCGLIIMGRPFFELWVPGNDSNLLQILSILCIGYMPLFIVSWPVANLNVIMNRNKIPALINVAGGLLNLSSMIILIKVLDMGIYIIPLTSLIIQVIYNLLFIPIYPCKGLEISKKTFYPEIIKCGIECIIICTIGCLILNYIEISSWIAFFDLSFFIAFVIFIVNLFVWFEQDERRYFLEKIKMTIYKKK